MFEQSPNMFPMRCRSFATTSLILMLISVAFETGCESGMAAIDRRTTALVHEASRSLGKEAYSPETIVPESRSPWSGTLEFEGQRPASVNPNAADFNYQARSEAENVIERLASYSATPDDAAKMVLNEALKYAVEHSREYRDAEETYVLAALELLVERHLWGPRFFDEITTTARTQGDNDLFDSSLSIVNELRATQRLPYGGDVSVRALASATEDLYQRVAGEGVQSADIILDANIPLLRGAGLAARDSRIQAERDVIYAARSFEQFRRNFLVSIASDFLTLVALQQGIANAERQLASFVQLEERAQALVKAGREEPFQAALAAQDTLFARDSLTSQQEQYRLTVDRFKVRLGMPTEQPLVIVKSEIGLKPPKVDLDEAVQMALLYRLDLQTSRDQVEDSRRTVAVARNQLLPDLNLTGNVSLPTDLDRVNERAGADFDPGDLDASAGLTFGVPLDREIERVRLRQSQIALERSIRSHDQFRDTVAVEVRAAGRDIDRAIFSLQLQEENIGIAKRRQESIDAAPARADARDRSEAVDALLRAEDDRDRARRDLQVAILNYLVATGQLRVTPNGMLQALNGMEITANPPPGEVEISNVGS